MARICSSVHRCHMATSHFPVDFPVQVFRFNHSGKWGVAIWQHSRQIRVKSQIHGEIWANLKEYEFLMFDSGGPMITRDNVLVGVANWVIPCAKDYPGDKL